MIYGGAWKKCMARLDVAMFNCILCDSDDEIPTDPVSVPISEAKVLPLPAGKSSFGAGALLKNAIGNWSRWLTDLFGIDDADSFENTKDDGNDDDEGRKDYDASFRSFDLLNAHKPVNQKRGTQQLCHGRILPRTNS